MSDIHPQWRFLRQTLYSLKRQYNVVATVCKVIDTNTDYTTGVKTFTTNKYLVQRAIMLPTDGKRQVEQGIAQLSANKFFVSQAGFDQEKALFIFDARDLPSGFQFNLDDFVLVDDEYYKVIKINEYEYDSGWMVHTKLVKGSDFVVEPPPPPPFTGTVSEFGNVGVGADKWFGGCLAGNNCIYGTPWLSPNILKIDPIADTVTQFASADSGFSGGALAANGFIYCMPFSHTHILRINPSNDTSSLVGPEFGSYFQGDTVLGASGNIYGIPMWYTAAIKIEPTTETISEIGPMIGVDKWQGGVLAPNDHIYGIPFNSTSILKLNSINDTFSTFGTLAGSSKWFGGVLVGNNIYGIPWNATSILKIDTTTDTISTFGNFPGFWKWQGGVLAPDGYIYCIPDRSTGILRIDPVQDIAVVLEQGFPTEEKWNQGVLAPPIEGVSNSRIYGIPWNRQSVLRIS